MSTSPTDPQRITDSTARQLLERAVQLDDDAFTLQQLSAAAAEAGISAAAFDQAVREWRDARRARNSVARPERVWNRLLRNAVSLAAGWAALAGLSALDRLLAAPWLVHKLTDPVGLALGAVIAVKVRARTGTAVLGGLAVSQATEYLLDFLSGAPAIHGLAPHVALMVAGIAGVSVGQHFWSNGSRGRPSASDNLPERWAPTDENATGLKLQAASA